jgi:Na+/melibiose symporter-like transporter
MGFFTNMIKYSIPGAGPLLIDAVDDYERREGVRTEGLAFSISGLMNKIGGGIGSAVGVAIIGLVGYTQGTDLTPSILRGINFSANLMPVIVMLLAIVPLAFYNVKEAGEGIVTKDETSSKEKADIA